MPKSGIMTFWNHLGDPAIAPGFPVLGEGAGSARGSAPVNKLRAARSGRKNVSSSALICRRFQSHSRRILLLPPFRHTCCTL